MLQNFWCPDTPAAAAAVQNSCPEDVRRCISIAGDVLENRFTFRDHWEMERTWEPVQFGPAESDIDWAHVPSFDAEWLYAMNRHTSFVNLGKAWQYTHDRRYAEKWARLIEGWIDRVPLTPQSEGNTWRSLEAGLRCEYWLRSIKLVEDSGLFVRPLRDKIEACLLQHGEYLTGKWGEFQNISNWGVLQDHGLFLLGVYFNRPEWQQLALERLDRNLHRSVLADGTDWVLDLASKEYSAAVEKHLPASVPLVRCVFGQEQEGKVVEKGTLCKMARGEMVRFMAETGAARPEDLQAFDRLGYRFSPRHSAENTLVFLRGE